MHPGPTTWGKLVLKFSHLKWVIKTISFKLTQLSPIPTPREWKAQLGSIICDIQEVVWILALQSQTNASLPRCTSYPLLLFLGLASPHSPSFRAVQMALVRTGRCYWSVCLRAVVNYSLKVYISKCWWLCHSRGLVYWTLVSSHENRLYLCWQLKGMQI